ncbi:type II secretion system protein [Clostridium sp. ZS2-4]|uniref:type II secretion system protein n=1 Tax=Clostridium sp. ZS2-4 TaxID=2987703 RepID=UPI00227C6DBA|nr:type II secretion system protein [Clostridium sp. ZS2-4]MCY6354058.1 type II secretion system protein [Clostridium sp. ZS2-4]
MNKKKGTTLIEIIIVLSILTVLSSMAIRNYYCIYNTVSNNFSVDMCSNSILHIINDSKQYCKSKNKSGYLVFDCIKSIEFYCGGNMVRSYTVPEGFMLKPLNSKGGSQIIHIDNFGNTGDACTICYADITGENHPITLRVGTNYVQIKQ